MAKNVPYRPVFSAEGALKAIERWAPGYMLLRETSALRIGRLDGLLVPVSGAAPIMRVQRDRRGVRQDSRKIYPGLVGIEVKLRRDDFLRGLNNGQYTRYARCLAGLYIATPKGICRTSEIPDFAGHLIVAQRPGYGLVCVCRRNPHWQERPLEVSSYWYILFDVAAAYQRRIREERDEVQHMKWVAGNEIICRLTQVLDRLERQMDGRQ